MVLKGYFFWVLSMKKITNISEKAKPVIKLMEWIIDESIVSKTDKTWRDHIDPTPILEKIAFYRPNKETCLSCTENGYYNYHLYMNLIAKEFKISSGQASFYLKTYFYGWNDEVINEYENKKMARFLKELEPKLNAKALSGTEAYQSYIIAITDKHPELKEDPDFNEVILRYFPEENQPKTEQDEFKEALALSEKC